jgi:hypothetical protein
MTRFICVTCGTQFSESASPPPACPICRDERQYVGWNGQAWTTLDEVRARHTLAFSEEDEGVTGIGVTPHFGIGQRALLVRTGAGNILWDCVTLVNQDAVQRITALGGLAAIAISHPHYYSAMGEWSDAFGGVPIHLHAADRQWVMREHPAIRYFEGDTLAIGPGVSLIRCGGHFAGATVMHVARAAGGAGAVFAGDVIAVNMDRASVTFMYSYPNAIPLGATAIRRIADVMAPFRFERIFGAFARRNVMADGRVAFDRSVTRYLKAIGT